MHCRGKSMGENGRCTDGAPGPAGLGSEAAKVKDGAPKRQNGGRVRINYG